MRSAPAILVSLFLAGAVCFIIMLPHHSSFFSHGTASGAATMETTKTDQLKKHALEQKMLKLKALKKSKTQRDPAAVISAAADDASFFSPTTFFDEDSRRAVWSEPALLENYSATRPFRACDPLPDSVEIKKDDSIVLGVVSETRMPAWREKHLRGQQQQSFSPQTSSRSCIDAFVLMVSNHRYVDGALVAADTLWNTSSLLRSRKACLVMLTSEKLNPDSVRQLSLLFDVVKAVRTLGSFVPKSYYKTTFDKVYLWSLTEYRHVMFLDADHFVNNAKELERLLVTAGDNSVNISSSSKKEFPANRIVAVGDHGYFQTGLMVVRPNMQVFVDLYLEFRYGTFGYNQWRARDGILIRNCFLKSNDGISHPGGIHHYYGYFKPWFNLAKQRKITKEPIDFGSMYGRWWERYRALHRDLFSKMPAPTGSSNKYGGHARAAHLKEQKRRKFKCRPTARLQQQNDDEIEYDTDIDSHCFMWVQRYRDSEEYLTPASDEVKNRWWDLVVPSFKIVQQGDHRVAGGGVDGAAAPSCNEVCQGKRLVCRDDAFQWTSLATCERLKKANVGCKRCVFVDNGVTLPLVNVETGDCSVHSFLATKFVPRCDAINSVTNGASSPRRICPCVAHRAQNASGVCVA